MSWEIHRPTSNMNRRIFKVETKDLVKKLKAAGFNDHVALSHEPELQWVTAKKIFTSKIIRCSGGTLKKIKACIQNGPSLKEDVVISFDEAMNIIESNNHMN